MAKRIGSNPRQSGFVIAVFMLLQCWLLPAYAFEVSDRAPLQIWFVRHAESEINVSTIPHQVADTGVSYPLTKRGMEQAIAFAEAQVNTPVVAIYTSTLLRAVQTSDALAFKHRLPVMLAPEAVEIDFGVPRDAREFNGVYQELRQKWLVEQNPDARHDNGESLADAQRRFLPFVREVMNRHAHDTGVIVIVAHGATLGFLVPLLATNVPPDFALHHPLTNTGIIKTELRDNSLVCIEWLGLTSERFEAASP